MNFCRLLLAFTLSSQFAFSQTRQEPFSFFVLGDMPYHLPEDYQRFENVIASLNKENPAFNVFVGDFKSSTTPCSDSSFHKILGYFSSFKNPLIYTPGDNEWTDCGKPEAGAFNREERLSAIRTLFFQDTLKSLGQHKIELKSESSYPEYSEYVENKRWIYQDVAFATIHIVGSNNNFNPNDNLGNGEYLKRSKANIFWLNELFLNATENKNLGIVLLIHADMIAPDKGKEGFETFLTELKKQVLLFKKPVLLVNGDSHEFKIDKPFYQDSLIKKVILNFTRLQVFGESDMHAVKVTINPKNQSLFEIQQFWITQ